MRALYKAISGPRVRRASSKGGGGYTCQSGSGWDEFTKRLTSDTATLEGVDKAINQWSLKQGEAI